MTDLYDTNRPAAEEKRAVISEARAYLFRTGVLMRMICACLLLLFTALFPLMISVGGILILIPFEIFVTAPMLYGLFYMGRRAADGEELSIADLFHAFRHAYWYSITSVLFALVLWAIPLLLYGLCVYGVVILTSIAAGTSTLGAIAVAVFGFAVCLLAVIPILLLQMPSYLFFSVRLKYGRLSFFRAARTSAWLLAGDVRGYLVLRLRFLWLDLLSCFSVCALFPIYTVPLMLTANAVYLDRLAQEHETIPFLKTKK